MHNKLNQVRQLLDQRQADGMLVESQPNFHWLSEGRGFIGLNSETACASLLITRDRACLISNNIEGQRLKDEEIASHFELVEFPWYDEKEKAQRIAEICPGKCLRDSDFPAQFVAMRTVFDQDEQREHAAIAIAIARILEEEMRALQPGTTELHLVGKLSERLWSINVEPVTLLVGFDDRLSRVRHLLPTGKKLEKLAIGSTAVRYRGMFVSVTRSICFGPIPDDTAQRFDAVSRVNAAIIQATRPGMTMDALFHRLVKAYADVGYPDEWQYHHQGGLTGYVSRESKASPGNTLTIVNNQAFGWNPTIAGTKAEETIAIRNNLPVVLTDTGEWPCKDYDGLSLPVLLQR